MNFRCCFYVTHPIQREKGLHEANENAAVDP